MKKNIYLTAVAIIILSSCTNDLNVEPLDTTVSTASTVYSDVTGYENLVTALTQTGYRTGEGDANLFLFAYDWRRDIAENAAELEKFLKSRRAILQKVYYKKFGIRDYPVKFDLVGHSMGGLLVRYFLRYGGKDLPEEESVLPRPDWSGMELTARAILIGTPNYGYPDACKELVNGLDYAPGAAAYPAAVIGTFPSCYQMIPPVNSRFLVSAEQNGTVLDPLDPEVWVRYQWGLLNPKQDPVLKILLPDVLTREARYAVALDHLKKCLARARKFQQAMRYCKDTPEDLELILFLGDSVETSRRLMPDPKTGLLKVIHYDSGDGKVPGMSARGDLRFARDLWYPHELPLILWKHVIHLPGSHMGIVNSKSFRNNLTYFLQSAPDARQLRDTSELLELEK